MAVAMPLNPGQKFTVDKVLQGLGNLLLFFLLFLLFSVSLGLRGLRGLALCDRMHIRLRDRGSRNTQMAFRTEVESRQISICQNRYPNTYAFFSPWPYTEKYNCLLVQSTSDLVSSAVEGLWLTTNTID
jgi:hypothetical protein